MLPYTSTFLDFIQDIQAEPRHNCFCQIKSDVSNFVRAVLWQFAGRAEFKTEIRAVFEECVIGEVNMAGTMRRLALLFHRHTAFLESLNRIFPKSYRFELSQGSSSGVTLITVVTPDGRTFWHVTPPPAALNSWAKEALWCIGRTRLDARDRSFWRLGKIKARLEKRPGVLSRFLAILDTCSESIVTIGGSKTGMEEMLRQVNGLFGDDPDLMFEFKTYWAESVAKSLECQKHASEEDGRAEDLEAFGHLYPYSGSEMRRGVQRAH